jgi:hypothetical protein
LRHSFDNRGDSVTELKLGDVAAEKLGHESRVAGVKGDTKSAKREGKARMRQRKYHVQKASDVKYRGIKRVATGFEPGKHNGSMGHYNIRADPMLGAGCVAVRRIPCACIGCQTQLEMKWTPNLPFNQQPRYKAITTCQNHEIFQGLNNWRLITLVNTSDSHLEVNDDVSESVLAGIAKMLSREVEIGGYGAVSMDDPEADGYYVLQWVAEPKILKEDITVDEVVIAKGELVVEGIYMNKVPRAKQWYTKAPDDDEDSLRTTVQMKHVVVASLDLTGESASQKLPRCCDVNAARQLGALHVSNDEHDMISDETSRRDRLELRVQLPDHESTSSESES